MKAKYFILILIFFLSPFSAYAKNLICPFMDYFYLSVPSEAKMINTPEVKGNLRYTKQNDGLFSLSCGDDKKRDSGDLHIDVGFDNANKCSIAIHDGPYVSTPSVTHVSCAGRIRYVGIDQISWYNYSLKFN